MGDCHQAIARRRDAEALKGGPVKTRWIMNAAATAACIASFVWPAVVQADAGGFQAPLVIGHRGGATGYLPDHTLENYALGIELGADFVEPDLVATKDGVLIARHEPNLIDTTNVADLPQFASRRRIAVIDGAPTDGFFASDFTLAEIRTLRAKQPLGDRDPRFNGLFPIPTFDEILAFVKRKTQEKGRPIGVYPETKHPTYHQGVGLPLEDRLLAALQRAGWNRRGAPVFIQSFETANLRYLRTRTSLPLIQLVDANDVNADGTLDYTPPYDKPYDWVVSHRAGLFSDLVTDAGLAEVRTYADGIGPWKPYLRSTAVGADGLRHLLPPTTVVARAHAAGLLVHPYTFRNEVSRQGSADYKGNPVNEYLDFYAQGVDGVFSDFADTAVAARAMYRLATDPAYADCLVGRTSCAHGKN
jgi:glycerophosphoryl diester phosphodiesterase